MNVVTRYADGYVVRTYVHSQQADGFHTTLDTERLADEQDAIVAEHINLDIVVDARPWSASRALDGHKF